MNTLTGCWWLFALPLHFLCLTSPYGYRVHPVTGKYAFHSGIDLRAHHDTVFAVLPGRVSGVAYDKCLGLNIHLDHGDFQTTYGHLLQVFVFVGDSLTAGSPMGITGSTGRVTGEHLHFSVRYNGVNIDPLHFLGTIANNLKSK